MCIARSFVHEECVKEEEHTQEECTPVQIRECHDDVLSWGYPCIKKEGDEK